MKEVFSVGVPFLAIDFIGVGVYQAFGKGSLALAFAIGRKVILEIPALFTLVILFRKLEKGAAALPSSEKG